MLLLSKSRSVVASWNVDLPDGEFFIEFEHGSASGKRVIWINGQVSGPGKHSSIRVFCLVNALALQELCSLCFHFEAGKYSFSFE